MDAYLVLKQLFNNGCLDSEPRRRFLSKGSSKRSATLLAACLVGALTSVIDLSTRAQEQAHTTEGINRGNYNIQQTVEFGYRFTNFTGNNSVYDTFLNLGPGVRVFEHTLHLRSLDHQGLVFDDFFVTSFGYGGDPNDVTRLRISKNKWYNFSASFRRDRNFWDYNLLANPLNPLNPAPFPTVPITFSPHQFALTRRMGDGGLTLSPQSRFRVRLGYSRNVSEGPSLSTTHQGTEALVFQSWKATENAYRFGFDFKLLPRTNLSYDQFLSYYKGDVTWQDQNFGFQLQPAGGAPIPVDLGLVFNAAAGQPCGAPILAGGMPNPACNGYLSYSRNDGRPRGISPTEQFSFQSNYVRNLDMAGRLTYTSAHVDTLDFGQISGGLAFPQVVGAGELFNGLITRTNVRQFLTAGPARTKRVNVSADFALTWRATDKFHIVDTYRYNSFRLPGQWTFATSNLFPQGPAPASSMLRPLAGFNPTTCPPPFTSITCPQHSASSPADISTGTSSLFFGETVSYNTTELQYDFSRRFGGRLGYRYGHRNIFDSKATTIAELFFPGPQFLPGTTTPATNRGDCSNPSNCTVQPDGSLLFSNANQPTSDRSIIHEHSALLGFWSRPKDALRISFDLELLGADRSFTRISPRQLQHYKLRATYKPLGWVSVGASLNIIENRNNVATINNLQHNRSYGFSAVLERSERFAVDLGYDYNDIFSQTNICFVSNPVITGLTATPCPQVTAFLQGISFYSNTTHFGYGSIMWKPIKRVTTTVGYAGSFVNGNTLILNLISPIGPLQFNYHKPYGSLVVDLVKGLSWKTSWGYYGYGEKAQPDLTGSRNFRGNLVNLAVRYAF